VAVGIFPLGAMVNHDCSPNTVHAFSGSRMLFRWGWPGLTCRALLAGGQREGGETEGQDAVERACRGTPSASNRMLFKWAARLQLSPQLLLASSPPCH
jgi:hypothetical protein